MTSAAVLADQVEEFIDRPHDPIHTMDRTAWAVAIRSEMPWMPLADADAAAVVLERRHWQGAR